MADDSNPPGSNADESSANPVSADSVATGAGGENQVTDHPTQVVPILQHPTEVIQAPAAPTEVFQAPTSPTQAYPTPELTAPSVPPVYPPQAPGYAQQPAAPAPPPGYAAGPMTPQGNYGYVPGYAGSPVGPVPDTSSNAIVAFVLSLVSWLLCAFYGIGVILAIVALVFASMAKKEIIASGGWKTGLGFVTAAKVLSWINIGVVAVVAVIVIVAGVFIAANPDKFDNSPGNPPSYPASSAPSFNTF